MTKKITKDEHTDMLQFYREQLINQSEQLAAQVRQLDDDQIKHRCFHNALNEALSVLDDMQCNRHPRRDDIPF